MDGMSLVFTFFCGSPNGPLSESVSISKMNITSGGAADRATKNQASHPSDVHLHVGLLAKCFQNDLISDEFPNYHF